MQAIRHIVRCTFFLINNSPGLVVMGGDSCSKGRGFESLQHLLDGHFFTYICCKNCSGVCLERPKKMLKEAGLARKNISVCWFKQSLLSSWWSGFESSNRQFRLRNRYVPTLGPYVGAIFVILSLQFPEAFNCVLKRQIIQTSLFVL